jgi:arylsulfatase A
LQQTKLALGDDLEKELGGLDLRSRMFNGQFANPEANRLRDEFRSMFYFNEALIPLMRKGGVDRVQLYDLASDLSQERDIAAEKPEIVARMKKRANAIYQSVMADAPEWLTPEELADAKKPQENTPDRPAPGASDTAKLLARIDKNPLPKGYDGSRHQPYVDSVMTGLKPEQRARVGQLWKEKRRLDPDMPNPGASFVKILTHVAEDVGTSQRPNVVILLADDLGSKDIGCYGGPVKTPALDSLAAKGVKFTNFYSAAPVCSPARATLLTGRHHLRTGVYTVIQDHIHNMHLKQDEVTIAELLKENGYDTVHLGKWHLGTPFRGMKKPWIDEHGFDYWFATDLNAAPSHHNPANFWRNREKVGEIKGYACQIVVDEAITWLDKKRDPDKPFFLNIWFHEPHAPLAAPPEIIKEYGELNDQAAIYSATIDNTDRAISRFVKHLETIGALENTVIIYTSDHGSYRHERNGNLSAGKGSLLEGGIRTPGIFYWPAGIKGGQVQDAPGAAMDILPTICGIADVKIPEGLHIDGTDLRPLLTNTGNEFVRHQPLTWHSPLSQPVAVIREGKYSLVGYRSEEYPKDKEAITAVIAKMRVHLEKHLGKELNPQQLMHECWNSPLKNPEYNKLRSEFVMLNTFQERWTPMIKAGTGGITRVSLFDLSKDPRQQKNLINQLPELAKRLQQSLLKINASVLEEAPIWGEDDTQTRIHRLDSDRRSTFDAFAYINRIPIEPEKDETPDDLDGRILSRLANQEGRVLVKLPPAMSRQAYEGFKLTLESDLKTTSGRCNTCHQLPNLGRTATPSPVPSLRNRSYSIERLREVMENKTHRSIKLDKRRLEQLHAFLQTLTDIPDKQFREQIIKASVLDNSGDLK